MKSIIGCQYKPTDDSWSINLTSSANDPYTNNRCWFAGKICGVDYIEPGTCIVVSEPFECIVDKETHKKRWMVMVEYDNKTFMVLYDPSNLI